MAEEQKTLHEQIKDLKILVEQVNAMTSTIMAQIETPDEPQTIIDKLQEFLSSPLNDIDEVGIKKVFAAAIAASKATNTLPKEMQNNVASAHEIAAIVDEGLSRAKANYQTSTGDLEKEEAAEYTADRIISRIVAWIKSPEGKKKIINVTAEIVLSYFCGLLPFSKVLGPIITFVLTHIAKKGAEYIIKGAKKIALIGASRVKKMLEHNKYRNSKIGLMVQP